MEKESRVEVMIEGGRGAILGLAAS
jgi:hypothetical protein